MARKRLTGQPNTMKKVNAGLIKDTLETMGSATRVEIAQKTKVSQPTVNSIVKQLLEKKEVVEVGYAMSNGGRKAMRYALNQEEISIAAILLFPNYIIYEIANGSGEPILKEKFIPGKNKKYLQSLKNVIKLLTEKNEKIKVVTVGVPAAVTKEGEVFAVPQIPELEGVNLLEELKDTTKIHIKIVNDINTTAYGYYHKRLESSIHDMIFVHFGEGLGASVIIRGEIVNGFSSFAGEIGYMQIGENKKAETLLTDEKSDCVDILGRMIINTICVINPPVIVLGGSRMSNEIVDKLRKICIEALPPGMVPNLLRAEDEAKFYVQGALKIASEAAKTEVRLIVD